MSETALTIYSKIGYQLGFGRSAPNSDTGKNLAILEALEEGFRQAYFPEPLPGMPAYQWTFLTPRATLAVVSGDQTVALPAGFASIVGDFTWPTGNSRDRRIEVISEMRLREILQGVTAYTGTPRYAAILPAVSSTLSVTFDCKFDGTYSLGYTYRVIPTFSGTSSSVYGGEQFSSLLLAACLAAAEQRIDSREETYKQQFQQRLAATIATDMQLRPNKVGSYYDDSARRFGAGIGHRSTGIPQFYLNGVLT